MKLPVLDHYGEDYFKTNWNLRMNTLRQYWTERKGVFNQQTLNSHGQDIINIRFIFLKLLLGICSNI